MTRSILALIATVALGGTAATASDGQLASNHFVDQTAQALQATPSQAMRHALTDRAGSPLAVSVVRNRDNALTANAVANVPSLGAAERQSQATAISGNTMAAPEGAAADANRPVIVE